MPATLERNVPILMDFEDIFESATGPWAVVVYNDEVHSFQEVEAILQRATGCSLEKAQALAMKIHREGRAIVFEGEQEECEKVAKIIASIELQVEAFKL